MINVDSWSPLKEVWLGDCYPKEFYNHLDSKVKDCFHEITEITQTDLQVIQAKLESLGVVVKRPFYEKVDDYLIDGHLQKPHITPRDFYFSHNDTLYFKDNFWGGRPWYATTHLYQQKKIINVEQRLPFDLQVAGSNIVKVGKDLYFDLLHENKSKEAVIELFKQKVHPYFKDFRCHLLFNGGHLDSCFTILQPGLILASKYFKDYDKTFPGWELINLDQPEFQNFKKSSIEYSDKNWYVPNLARDNSFDKHIVTYALEWVGNFKETYFDLNCLIVDEKNVLMLGENEHLFKTLEKKGINVHTVPFRARTFWDGGLHCLTVDILRDSKLIDHFNFKEDLIIY
jgi:hypothetical protein